MISSRKAIEYYESLSNEIECHKSQIDSRILSNNNLVEGSCFFYGESSPQKIDEYFFIYKRVNFVNVIKDFQVKKMIEIGFNAGHSALVFLAALPKDGKLLCFDLGEHSYMLPCFNYLQSSYPALSTVITGDSKQTMPAYVEANPSEVGTYDCIHVDGGHDSQTVFSDFIQSNSLLKPGGILIIDDTQYMCILYLIPMLLDRGYTFLYQIPTYCYSHVCLQKPY
jgi:hypothetical protein